MFLHGIFILTVGYELRFIDDHEKLKIVVLAYYYDGMNREDQYNLGFQTCLTVWSLSSE